MRVNQTALAKEIESLVGEEHVTREPSLTIDGLTPSLIVRPGSADEVASCIKVCSESDAAIIPAGQSTWLECGNPVRRADVVLSLSRMRRVIEYSPPDLTATVEAGLTLSEFNDLTLKARQWLPLDPPGFRTASVGAIAACNSSGALRLGFGTPRDYVIGLKLIHADGRESKSGGRVVKNVAGYDMNKLYVGSYGTLAIITELTFKLRPLTECSSTLLITSSALDMLLHLAAEVLASELQPASVMLARRLKSPSTDSLLIRFIDNNAAVANQVDWVMGAAGENYQVRNLSAGQAEALWEGVAELDDRAIIVKLSVPLSTMPAEFERIVSAQPDCAATVDLGAGIIRVALDSSERSAIELIGELRRGTASVGGTAVIEKAPLEVKRAVDVWGDTGSTAELMKSIKESFDSELILNPGKFGE